jgi:hypothetical protein
MRREPRPDGLRSHLAATQTQDRGGGHAEQREQQHRVGGLYGAAPRPDPTRAWRTNTLATAVDRFLAAAADLGVEVDTQHYPEGTKTAADAAAAIGCDVAQIVKSLVFMADEGPVLVLTSGANRVDTAQGRCGGRRGKGPQG